jgi:2-oxoglutarate ferredoxin oxidoreductase subunit gamma
MRLIYVREQKTRYEVVLAGSGGQGLVVSGMMLAEAAMQEGKNVVQTVSYGIATRGGFSMAEVIIDSGEIIFQQVQKVDVALVLTEEAMEKFHSLARTGALVFYDSTLVKSPGGDHLYCYPFLEMASAIGHAGTANIIALGCIASMTGMVKPQSIAEVLKGRFSGKVLNMNLAALQKGVELTAN